MSKTHYEEVLEKVTETERKRLYQNGPFVCKQHKCAHFKAKHSVIISDFIYRCSVLNCEYKEREPIERKSSIDISDVIIPF